VLGFPESVTESVFGDYFSSRNRDARLSASGTNAPFVPVFLFSAARASPGASGPITANRPKA
jgi:hypothetical protein